MGSGTLAAKSAMTRLVRRILVVDDDAPVRREVCRALRSRGYEVVEAPTVAAALELIRARFDLIVLDVRLPDGCGVDVARAASEMVPAPLIVAMSGEASAQEAFGLAELGAVQFVTKPFSVDELLKAIERASMPDSRFRALIKTYVGRENMLEVQESVHATMVREAIAMSGGNLADAAKILGMCRAPFGWRADLTEIT